MKKNLILIILFLTLVLVLPVFNIQTDVVYCTCPSTGECQCPDHFTFENRPLPLAIQSQYEYSHKANRDGFNKGLLKALVASFSVTFILGMLLAPLGKVSR